MEEAHYRNALLECPVYMNLVQQEFYTWFDAYYFFFGELFNSYLSRLCGSLHHGLLVDSSKIICFRFNCRSHVLFLIFSLTSQDSSCIFFLLFDLLLHREFSLLKHHRIFKNELRCRDMYVVRYVSLDRCTLCLVFFCINLSWNLLRRCIRSLNALLKSLINLLWLLLLYLAIKQRGCKKNLGVRAFTKLVTHFINFLHIHCLHDITF